MSYKRLIPCIFIKDGKAVRWIDDPTVVSKDNFTAVILDQMLMFEQCIKII